MPTDAVVPSIQAGLRMRGRRRGREPFGCGHLVVLVVGLGLGTSGLGCDMGHQSAAPIPPAEAYDAPSDFAGVWVGEADGTVGTLEITSLSEGRYRGHFTGDDIEVEYVMAMEQQQVPTGDDAMPGNRITFHWQDGRRAKGEGWMLINREDSALTGAFGTQGMMDRELTFIRVE